MGKHCTIIIPLLLFIVAFTGLILIGKSVNEDNESLQKKISKGKSIKREVNNNNEDDEILHQIDLLIQKYNSGKIPQLLPKLPPIKEAEKNVDPWNIKTSSQPKSTVLKKTKERNVYKQKKAPVANKESKSIAGYLNVHYWESFCGSRVEDLKRNIHFPYYPSEAGNITKFYVQRYESGFGQRIFGYLHPPETGNFTFAVSCDDNCEVWLSTSNSPKDIKEIANVGTFEEPANTKVADFQSHPSQISKPIHLSKNKKYYVEVLHKQGAYKDHVLLAWLAPSWTRIRTIKSEDISSFLDVNQKILDVNEYKRFIPSTRASSDLQDKHFNNSIYQYDREKYPFTSYDEREDFFKIPSVDMNDFVGVLKSKEYKPSYLLDFKPRRYEGVNLMHESAVYPTDFTDLTHMTLYESCNNPRSTDSHLNYLPGFEGMDQGENIGDEEENVVHDLSTKPVLTNLKKASYNSRNTKRPKTTPAMSFIGNFRTHKSRKLLFFDTEEKESYPKKEKLVTTEDPSDVNEGDILKKMKGARQKSYSRNTVQTREKYGRHFYHAPTESRPKYPLKTSERKIGRYSSYYSRFSNRRRRKEKLYHFNKKVFFKNGQLVDDGNTTTAVDSKAMLIHFYPLFGTATYYLVQKPPRRFLWKYKTFLSKCRTDGNLPLQSEVAKGVVRKYMKEICKKHGSKYTLKRIVNVEENHDVVKGDKYLVEIELKVNNEALPRRLSKYIYRDMKTDELFEPQDFVWDPQATVHVIVPVKNQGRWVQHFIDNMEKIYLETRDSKLNVIIVDFNSTDIDIEKSLKKSALKRYNFLQLGGAFQRALGLQAGADIIENGDDFIFTCDLHLDIPAILIDTIRKHTIKKKLSFAPMVHRLSCGYTPDLPYGLWEVEGYGLFSISKHDFDRIGGMNTKEFKTKWGGEDWEFLDRALGHGLEVERLRIPNFFHHYHSKRKMWQASSTTPSTTTDADSTASLKV